MDETIILQDEEENRPVLVTTTRIKVGAQTYSLQGVTDVRARRELVSHDRWRYFRAITILFACVIVAVAGGHVSGWISIGSLVFLFFYLVGFDSKMLHTLYHEAFRIVFVRNDTEVVCYTDECPYDPGFSSAGLSQSEIAHRQKLFDKAKARFEAISNALSIAIGKGNASDGSHTGGL